MLCALPLHEATDPEYEIFYLGHDTNMIHHIFAVSLPCNKESIKKKRFVMI